MKLYWFFIFLIDCRQVVQGWKFRFHPMKVFLQENLKDRVTESIKTSNFPSGKSIRHRIAAIVLGSTLITPIINANIPINLSDRFIVHASESSIESQYQEFSEVWKLSNENFFDSTHNNHDWEKIRIEYINRLRNGADEHELTKKLVQLLGDKYSRLLDKNVFESLWKYDAIGVGLLFQSETDKMFVAAPPIQGSSAATAGIHQNDLIYRINGVSTEKMTAVQLLDMMSNDENDYVTIEYASPSSSSEHVTTSLLRSKQRASNPVSFSAQQLADGSLAGYIRLGEFNSEAVPGLKTALTELQKQGAQEILLDLRGNTGGGFQFALNIGGMFMARRLLTILSHNLQDLLITQCRTTAPW